LRHYFALPVVALFLAGMTNAAPITLTALLSGANENPSTGSPGTGTAIVILDPALHTLDVNVVFSGLFATIPGTSNPSGTTASHIHCCIAPPGNAGVATAVPTFPGFPLGVTSGTYHQSFDLLVSSTYNTAFITSHGGTVALADAALETGLLTAQTYLNIHTNAFGGGEIRGTLAAPEPTTAGLGLISAVFFAALWIAQKRRVGATQ